MRSILRATSLVVAVALYGCSPDDATDTATSQTRSPRRGARASEERVAELDLKGMLSPVPEYEGQGRNLFAYGPERRAPRPAPPRPAPTERPTAQARPTTTVPPRAPAASGPRLNVKYAGFVEKTEPSGDKAKYAIFLDGNEILAGAEGEIVANRFTVVEIGLESVTVSAEGSSATQRIPLQAN